MEDLKREILLLWHTRYPNVNTRYERMLFVRKWIIKDFSHLLEGISNKKLWLLIEEYTTVFG
jgi:hypothetical protein